MSVVKIKNLSFEIKLSAYSSLTDLLAILNTQFMLEDNIIDQIIKFYADGTEQYNSLVNDHLQNLGFGRASKNTVIETMCLEDGTCILDIDYVFNARDKFCAFEKRLQFVKLYHELQKEE